MNILYKILLQQIVFFVFEIGKIDAHICIVIKSQKRFKPMMLKSAKDKQVKPGMSMVFFLLFCSAFTFGQGWERTLGGNAEDQGQDLVMAENGDFVVAGFSESFPGNGFQVYVTRRDIDGDLVWEKHFGGQFADKAFAIVNVNDGFVLAGDTEPALGQELNALLIKIDNDGNLVWSKSFGGALRDQIFDLIHTSDGGFLLTGRTRSFGTGEFDMYLIKTDADGEFEWQRTYDNNSEEDEGWALVETSDAYLIVGKTKRVNSEVFLVKASKTDGEEIDRRLHPRNGSMNPEDAILMDNGNVLIAGYNSGQGTGNRAFLLEVNTSLDEQGSQFYGQGAEQFFRSVTKLPNGNYVAAGAIVTQDDPSIGKGYLVQVNAGAQFVEDLIIKTNITKDINSIIVSPKGEIVCTGNTGLGQVSDAFLLKTDYFLNFGQKFIEGKVFYDRLNNCLFDTGEKPLKGWTIEVTNEADGISVFTTTDADGNYFFRVDSGEYTIQAHANNSYWQSCFNNKTIVFDNLDTARFNFPMEAVFGCAYLEVDATAGEFEICRPSVVNINYCNHGVTDQPETLVEVNLDDYLEVVNTSIPILSRVDNSLTFDVGEVKSGECGDFQIQVLLDCNTPETGLAHCIEAHIYPDSVCTPDDPQWDNSSVAVEAVCENDTVRFSVKNTGTGDMTQAKQALIIEDQILIKVIPFQLDSGEIEQIYSLPGTGKTYRIITEQPAGHPGESFPTKALEGCTSGGVISKGYVNRFEEDEKDAFVSVACIENHNSDDTTYLRGYPKGIDDSLITASTDLEYHIRFQNVGTDTVNRVVVRDSISQFLDVTTVRPGAASHPYTFEILENGILKFIFDDINLPGSSVNEAESAGFVQFKISQKLSNTAGTVILNSAAINVGYQTGSITNVTRHVVGGAQLADFIEIKTAVGEVEIPGISVNAFPNPFTETAIFEIKGNPIKTDYTFEIFDVTGRSLRKEDFTGNRFTFYRGDLLPGFYAYRITTQGILLNSGKILISKSNR